MKPYLILSVFLAYTALLFGITWLTSRKADNESYYTGNRSSLWYVVAYGMIGASLSGVTFMSVPGWVGNTGFSYLMVVFGYFFGYLVIAFVLLPVYYRMKLTSIYTYLESRFGFFSYKSGSVLFLVSRCLGASLRMFLVVNVLQIFVFESFGIPFFVTACIFILLVILYTLKGGIKTIIWTDTLQTTFMLLALFITIFLVIGQLDMGVGEWFDTIINSKYSYVIVDDWTARNHWLKQFLSGMFITITMTGLDQEMMQKNLSCKSLRDAKKNMLVFSVIVVVVNFIFLLLGATLFLYAQSKNISVPALTDDLFPMVSLRFLSPLAGIVFLVGLISAAYPSADGALTSLTTSFTIDIFGIQKKNWSEKKKGKVRSIFHVCFAILLLGLVVMFSEMNDRSVIDKLFTIAGYTYGPLLGLYAFGLFTKFSIRDIAVPFVAVLSPILCWLLSENSVQLLNGYKFGFELLLINGAITFIGLLIFSKRKLK
ncbi:MAG: sodium:solute symporter [Bacteroidota bacterium]